MAPKKNQQSSPKAAKCPLSRTAFRHHAKPLIVEIDGKKLMADVKEFSTGSFGWHTAEKIVLYIEGVPVRAQIGLTITVIGSKETPQDDE